jgi:hypothetical protein
MVVVMYSCMHSSLRGEVPVLNHDNMKKYERFSASVLDAMSGELLRFGCFNPVDSAQVHTG